MCLTNQSQMYFKCTATKLLTFISQMHNLHVAYYFRMQRFRLYFMTENLFCQGHKNKTVVWMTHVRPVTHLCHHLCHVTRRVTQTCARLPPVGLMLSSQKSPFKVLSSCKYDIDSFYNNGKHHIFVFTEVTERNAYLESGVLLCNGYF